MTLKEYIKQVIEQAPKDGQSVQFDVGVEATAYGIEVDSLSQNRIRFSVVLERE